jgi:hypothetical protein
MAFAQRKQAPKALITQEFAKLKKKTLHMQAKSSIFETLAKAVRKFEREMAYIYGSHSHRHAIDCKQVDIASAKPSYRSPKRARRKQWQLVIQMRWE